MKSSSILKRKSTSLIILLFIASTGFSQQKDKNSNSKSIFENKCAKCHGKDGTKGLFGAKNLQKSKLSDHDYFSIISNGKNIMPNWGKRLTQNQIDLVIQYIKLLRH
ncbi:cytochrome c [Flavobacterium sp.]|uniref:c-type cytochrome n=1 Tax=Flavobacterium sp. TaxID=239 RepID=UPI00262890A8|nr:cytochrome c [Flavobacterium sp.]